MMSSDSYFSVAVHMKTYIGASVQSTKRGDASAVMFFVRILRIRYQSCCHVPAPSILLQLERTVHMAGRSARKTVFCTDRYF